jgi:hypothetical protein
LHPRGWFLMPAPALFKQQKLDLKQQFKSFSFGLVGGRHGPEVLDSHTQPSTNT